MRLRRTIFALLAIGIAGGCEADREAELLEVTSISPMRLAPDRMIRVEGSGFPPGRRARVRFEGTMHRPGVRPRETTFEITGRAVAAERIEARFPAHALTTLGGRGTLHGRVVAVFDAARDRGLVIGRSEPMEIDVGTGPVQRLRGELSRRRQASATTERFGLVLGEELPEVEGLPILQVREDSVAERAGLIASDRLLSVEGVHAHDLSDIVPVPGSDAMQLRVMRPGEAAPFTARLPIDNHAAHEVRPETLRAAWIALAWVLLVLVLLAPTAGAADWIARAARGTPRPSPSRSWKARWRRVRRELPTVTVGLGLLAAIPALDHILAPFLQVEGLVLGALALRVGALWIGTAGRPLRVRALALASGFGSIVAIGFAFGALAALGGTTDLGGLSAQPAAPWRWTLVTVPVAVPALALTVLAAQWPTLDAQSPALANAIDDLVLLVVAASLVALLAGGWGIELGRGPIRLARGALFVGMSYGLWLWLRRARRATTPSRAGRIGAVVLVVIVIVGTLSSIVLEPPEALTAGIARVLAGATAILLLSALARAVAGRVSPRPISLRRFA